MRQELTEKLSLEQEKIASYWDHKGGHIVKSNSGSLMVILGKRIGHDGRYVIDWVSFDHSNCRGITPLFSHTRKESCNCNLDNWVGEGEEAYTEHDPDCSHCKGTGEATVKVTGMVEHKELASSGKELIKTLLSKALNSIS
jgi:hypothetical protein